MKVIRFLVQNAAPLFFVVAISALLPVARAQAEFQVGTAADSVDLQNHPEAVPYEDGWAIPLAGMRPDWYTPAVEEQVLAAGGTPVAAPTDAPLPSEIGIRPGSWMISPYGCTMNFVFIKPIIAGTRIGKMLQIAKGWPW